MTHRYAILAATAVFVFVAAYSAAKGDDLPSGLPKAAVRVDQAASKPIAQEVHRVLKDEGTAHPRAAGDRDNEQPCGDEDLLGRDSNTATKSREDAPRPEPTSLGKHGFANSNGVRIHYVTAGEGPLLVMLHGFPDYWYGWRKQMPALARHFQVVAVDLRGYNFSDKPEGVENYALAKLVEDLKAVITHFDRKKAVLVGHDWGGMIAWLFAMQYPEMTDRLIVLNIPHPACLTRELEHNPKQQQASAYARRFQQADAIELLTAEGLTFWVTDKDAKRKYAEAFRRSSFEAMLNYYKANFPRMPYKETTDYPKVKCPVLMIHGLNDTALLASGLNGTWEHVEKEFTLVTVPGAGHYVQEDAASLVTDQIVRWLTR